MPKTTHADIQLLVLKGKPDGVTAMIDAGTVSAHTLRRALSELESEDVDSEAVSSFRETLTGLGFLNEPLRKPDVGEERGYKSFAVDGSHYIRVNVTHFDEHVGAVFPCRFSIDDIRVRRPDEE